MVFSLEELSQLGRVHFQELVFVVGSFTVGGETKAILTISRKDLHYHPPAGFISRVRLLLTEDKGYDLQILMRSKETGFVDSTDKFLELCSIIDPAGGYKFCPGIDINEYESEYFSIIRYDLKSVRRISDPIARIDSSKCAFWHKLAKNASIFEKPMDSVLCFFCKRLKGELGRHITSASKVTLLDKENRLRPSSNFPVKYLSPASQNKRKRRTQLERKNDKKQLKKYEFTDVVLDDDQHREMTQIMEKISKGSFIDDLFVEGNTHGAGELMKDLWENDKRYIKQEFEKDQKDNCTYSACWFVGYVCAL